VFESGEFNMHIIIDKLTPVTILILFLSYKRRAILLGRTK
jgi:hypothetical protein